MNECTAKHGHPHGSAPGGAGPQVIAWEITRRCPLACRHCRAGARNQAYNGELTTAECLRVVMAPCGVSVDDEAIRKMRESGVQAISLSVDGATAAQHDDFRGVTGSFDANLRAMDCARRGGMPFQINTTVSQVNVDDLDAIHELAMREGTSQLDLFFLVPVGRGAGIRQFALSAERSEQALEWALKMNAKGPLRIKTTCAPQIVRVRSRLGMNSAGPARHGGTGGCMAGRGFVFISHTGILQPCGFCDVPSGDLLAEEPSCPHQPAPRKPI